MPNQWLAIDVSTSPSARARDARHAWERFLDDPRYLDEPLGVADVRVPIAESWRRSAAVGIDPSHWLAPIELDEKESGERLAEHAVGRHTAVLRECLSAIADDAEHLVVVSDGDGLLLSVEGNHRVREQAAAEINFAAGSRWSELAAGTNAIGTAIAADHAVQVFAGEHFSERVQWWTCAAAPIHDPVSGRVVALVDVTARLETVHPYSLAVVMAAAATVEGCMLAERCEHEHALLERHAENARSSRSTHSALVSREGRVLLPGPGGWCPRPGELPAAGGELVLEDGLEVIAEPLSGGEAFLLSTQAAPRRRARPPDLSLQVLGRDRARLQIDGGSEVELSRRHSEILVLLSVHEAGMTGEQLATALYGNAGKPATARAEVSRLRRLLPGVQTEPYRLEAGVVLTDLARLRRLLRHGDLAAAIASYPGPVLPRSVAPRVEEIRDELDGWLRRAVIESDNIETLWAWLNTASGEEDIRAWRRFLSTVAHDDGRRGLAAARLERLRQVFEIGPGHGAQPALVR